MIINIHIIATCIFSILSQKFLLFLFENCVIKKKVTNIHINICKVNCDVYKLLVIHISIF